MKNPNISTSSKRMVKTLASTAVILSLAACDADTLGNLQSDLAGGDDVNINLSQ